MKATFNLRIDAELKNKFSQKLKERNETATSVVVKAIEAYCNDSNAVTPDNKGGNDVTLDTNGSNDVTPDSDGSNDVTPDSDGSNDPSSRAQEQHGTSTVHSQEVADLRKEVDRLKHEMRWGDRYFSELQSQVYSVKSQLLTLESSIEPRLETYLADNPDMENGALWDSLDYMAERIDYLSTPFDTTSSTIEVVHDTPNMSREKESTSGNTPSEIPLEATKEESEDVSPENSTEAPDEPHKEVSEDNVDQTERLLDTEEGWKPLEELAEELGIENVGNLKTNISKKFPEGGKFATHTLRKGRGRIAVRREVMESGRTKNGSMMARKIDCNYNPIP